MKPTAAINDVDSPRIIYMLLSATKRMLLGERNWFENLLEILNFKELSHEIYQNSNSGDPLQNEWNIKITAQTLHEGINNTANKKGDMDGQTWRRWKRIAIGVFENRFSKLENS